MQFCVSTTHKLCKIQFELLPCSFAALIGIWRKHRSSCKFKHLPQIAQHKWIENVCDVFSARLLFFFSDNLLNVPNTTFECSWDDFSMLFFLLRTWIFYVNLFCNTSCEIWKGKIWTFHSNSLQESSARLKYRTRAENRKKFFRTFWFIFMRLIRWRQNIYAKIFHSLVITSDNFLRTL